MFFNFFRTLSLIIHLTFFNKTKDRIRKKRGKHDKRLNKKNFRKKNKKINFKVWHRGFEIHFYPPPPRSAGAFLIYAKRWFDWYYKAFSAILSGRYITGFSKSTFPESFKLRKSATRINKAVLFSGSVVLLNSCSKTCLILSFVNSIPADKWTKWSFCASLFNCTVLVW